MKSRIAVTEEETRAAQLAPDSLAKSIELFQQHGALWLEGVFQKDLIERLRIYYEKKYQSLSRKELKKRDASVGDRRFMITVNIKGEFNNPELYANPILLPLLDKIFSGRFRIASFGSVVALPGAEDQPIHLDHPPLFGSEELCNNLPVHALTMVVPLIDVSDDVGATAIWEGSHRSADRIEQLRRLMEEPDYSQASFPLTKQGDAYLMDYRVIHGGRANRSETARPILYIVFSRPWFRDAFNFSSQPSVQLNDKQRKKVPKKFRQLFA